MKEKHKNRRQEKLQCHHNPPKWWALKMAHLPKSFYGDIQHTRMVTPQEHRLINETYKEEMPKADALMPKKGVIWRETRVIPRETVLFRLSLLK